MYVHAQVCEEFTVNCQVCQFLNGHLSMHFMLMKHLYTQLKTKNETTPPKEKTPKKKAPPKKRKTKPTKIMQEIQFRQVIYVCAMGFCNGEW